MTKENIEPKVKLMSLNALKSTTGTAARKERHHALAVLGLPGALEPRHVGDAGRRRIASRTLGEVGAVDAGGADADQHLVRPRHRVGPLLDLDPSVPDHRGAHALNLGRPALRTPLVTVCYLPHGVRRAPRRGATGVLVTACY